MDTGYELNERPTADVKYMIAGWEQWADAGSVSSGMPGWLVSKTGARKIGQLRNQGFYVFQVPGAHHFLRPVVKLEDGYRREMSQRSNDLYYAGDSRKGLFVFRGDEPHVNAELYAESFLAMVKDLGIKRVAVVGGVYGEMPYDRDRGVSCVYSLPHMKDELSRYALEFSDYEGGVSIGTYLAHWAEKWDIELAVFYAMVPAYDFSERSDSVEGLRIENDFRAWHELMRRFNHMLDLGIDLSDLKRESEELVSQMEARLSELEREMPQLKVREYMKGVLEQFTETPFMPLDDMWERELGDLFSRLDQK
jgi:predicted ATP-grasp superfamily ATP-dependent carboligase